MAKFRLDSIAQLARQMQFTPQETRFAQLSAAEELLHLVDPARAYPLDFVIFRITSYHPKHTDGALLTGLALQHDLGLLIEEVSRTLDLTAGTTSEPVLMIGDVCERFNVTSKTIQRWRRRGLAARRFTFADGKERVGFLLSSVERFLGAANVSQLNEVEKETIIRHARRLVQGGRCEREIAWRIARRVGRSPMAILHTLRKHDAENPADAILAAAAPPLGPRERLAILKGHRHGRSLRYLARRVGRPLSSIYQVILDERIARLSRRKTRFIDDPLYHQSDAGQVIEALLTQQELAEPLQGEDLRIPRDLPPYLQDLYRTPLLTLARERALFLKLNYHKYEFATARRRLDPEVAGGRDLARLEACLAQVTAARNSIVRANLRLVVSVARKHLRPGLSLLELVSDGNITLMRAVDGFDIHKGNRFSTYATFALMKGFARSVPRMLAAQRGTGVDVAILANIPDLRVRAAERLLDGDEVRQLLLHLDERERRVVTGHYGLDDAPATYEQLGERLGVSKERIRQIERTALAKLRTAAGQLD